nr:hypothetical protein [Tanacetum cinerariifolium]
MNTLDHLLCDFGSQSPPLDLLENYGFLLFLVPEDSGDGGEVLSTGFKDWGAHGDWFSFFKRRASSLVCIDDNRSCMKHWKSGFFLIDRRDILDFMVWRHRSAAIDDPRPASGSFSMADVRRLSAHLIKLRDIPEGVLVLSRLSRVWKILVYDMVLQGADGNDMGEEPHLDVRPTLQRLPLYCTSSAKILAKAEAFQKQKASTSGATSSHVAKHTRSALAQLSGSTTHPSLFVGNSDDESDDDDDACVEILLVTPIRSADVTPSLGNQGRSSAAPAAEGLGTRDSRGKGIMVDEAAAPDAIHTDFFPFYVGPYYATYPEGGVAGNCEFTRDEFSYTGKMVRVEGLSDDQLTAKMSVLYSDSRLKGYEEKVASLTGLELQVSTLKRFQGELLSLASSGGFERGLSMHQTKDEFAVVLKKMAHFVLGAQSKLAEASHLFEPEKLARPANVPASRDARVSPPVAKELTVTLVSKSLEMIDGATHAKSESAFVHGTSHVLDDVAEVTAVRPKRVSSGPTDVVVVKQIT